MHGWWNHMNLCCFWHQFDIVMSKIQKFGICDFQVGYWATDNLFGIKLRHVLYCFWPLKFIFEEKTQIDFAAVGRIEQFWVFRPILRKNAIFEIFSESSCWLKDMYPEYNISKNYKYILKNGLATAKNVKFWNFSLWGWNLKKWL